MNPIKRFLSYCDIRQGRTLIVGSKIHEGTDKQDRRQLYADAVGIDMEEGDGVDLVLDLEEPLPRFLGNDFDHIECTSVLEHSRRPWLLASNIELLMTEGATLLVMVPWVWRQHNYPQDFWRMTPTAVASLFPSIRWEAETYIVEDELTPKVPSHECNGVRYLARSELIMFGRKCTSCF